MATKEKDKLKHEALSNLFHRIFFKKRKLRLITLIKTLKVSFLPLLPVGLQRGWVIGLDNWQEMGVKEIICFS